MKDKVIIGGLPMWKICQWYCLFFWCFQALV